MYKTTFANYQKSKNFLTLKNFYNLMKPRVMSLVVFTAFVGLIISNKQLDFATSALALFFVALGAGAAGALNMWYDSEIDAVMSRTCLRPIPLGKISNTQALYFGISLSLISIVGLYLVSNILSASILAITIGFYIFIYTIWLKRRSVQNIVIGGAAGAFPPVIGWAIANNSLSIEPIILFLIIFFWTPSHFWSLSLYKSEDYKKAKIPMLPVVSGVDFTKKNIFAYALILFPITILPFYFNFAGLVYLVPTIILGAFYIFLTFKLLNANNKKDIGKFSKKIFAFSILYLFLIFTLLLIESFIKFF
ncbi:MAG: protoheme IX farnesyltransferase [Candidatus Fonsibacter lacus]|nr:protoheme IX farnesyltransferase [Candidatus Fonsibacter lacus]